ncbi:MAG: hypothetical protein A3H98_01320 [Bacteroidetes bacterium RIFCSPLOWO2_02_FULL_36_8]|nr:MAG: hypothetical protein A3H98_01320 [Bacteroidetes bacterium RIFCSPLOWO2_02_FULL_36_8]OFY71620.1 MAG: hypothetical protein A3G23_01780 [Bacteroidetes bacterium RIFCSPLOWO2_12_FULL_37_12]
MNIKQKLFAITVIAVISGLSLKAQDLRYTQYHASPLKLNPALMGANKDLQLIFNYRDQWKDIDKGFNTMTFNFLFPIIFEKGRDKLDFGINAIQDKEGAFTTGNIALAAAYDLKVSKSGNHICFSLMGEFVQKGIDRSSLTFDEQYSLGEYKSSNSNGEQNLEKQISYPDIGAGFMWNFNPAKTEESGIKAYAGVSGFHLNQPNATFHKGDGKLPIRFVYLGGVKIVSRGHFDFTPNLRIVTQKGSQEVAAGLNVDYNITDNAKLIIGSVHKTNDAIGMLVGFQSKFFALGYSYDIYNSDITKVVANANANEITILLKFDRAEKKGLDINPSPYPLF